MARARELGVAPLQIAFGPGGERRLEPRRDARKQAPDGFQMRDFAAPIEIGGGGFDGHVALQGSGGKIGEHRFRDLTQGTDPILTVGLGSLRRSLRRDSESRQRLKKCAPVIHDGNSVAHFSAPRF